MNLAEFWSGTWGGPMFAAVVNHLWQSTVVAGAACVLAFALRKNHAQVRYWVWFVASVKFLVPFSVLMEMGAWLRSFIPATAARPSVARVVEQVAQPFARGTVFEGAGSAVAAVTAHQANFWPGLLAGIWVCGVAVVSIKWMVGWLHLRDMVRMATPVPEFVLSHPSGKGLRLDGAPDICGGSEKSESGFGLSHPSGKRLRLDGAPGICGWSEKSESGFVLSHPSGKGLRLDGAPGICGGSEKPESGVVLSHPSGKRAAWMGHGCSVLELAGDVPVLCSTAFMEPGIFGIFQPVLLLPDGIVERLSAEQMRSILAHEMCHVRRRDNLTFAVHMIVETLFWFFPLIWWIGARLIEERERACDEAVIAQGGEAQVYAEGILNVCKFYVESPVACAAGVTGSDLKKRIVRIMSEQVVRGLDLRKKFLLGAAGALALALPLVLGLIHAGAVIAETRAEDELPNLPKFDVASIKPHKDEPNGMMRIGFDLTPDGINANGVPGRMIVRQAFGVSDDRILNEPDWLKSARYDVDAKVSPEDAPKLKGMTPRQRSVMLLPVLEDRFGLKFHHETRELNVYTLVVAKGGPKLKVAQPDETTDGPSGGDGDRGPVTARQAGPGPVAGKPGDGGPMPAPHPGQTFMRMSPQGATLEGRGMPIDALVATLSRELGATVIDKTDLTGKYDYTLNFLPEYGMSKGFGVGPPPPPPASVGGGASPSGGPETAPGDTPPSLVDAIQQQLGLKLVQQKEPVDVIVIDHIEQPSAN